MDALLSIKREYSLLFWGPLSRAFCLNLFVFCHSLQALYGKPPGEEPHVHQSYKWTQVLVSVHVTEPTFPI